MKLCSLVLLLDIEAAGLSDSSLCCSLTHCALVAQLYASAVLLLLLTGTALLRSLPCCWALTDDVLG